MGGCVQPITPRRTSMSCHPRVTEWTDTIQTHLPHVSKPQATVLALWRFGMVLARSCALTAVSSLLAAGRHRKEPTVRQQLREWDSDVKRQRGAQPQGLHLETGLAALLGGRVRWW